MTHERKRLPSFEEIRTGVDLKTDASDETPHGADLYIEAAKKMFDERTYDTMTGLLKRDVFGERVGTYIESNPEAEFVLAFIDLDKFKAINTRYGHAGGNEILRLVGAGIHHAFRREGEFASRLGGDEFAIFIPKDMPKQGTEEELSVRGEKTEEDLRDYIANEIINSTLEQIPKKDLPDDERSKIYEELSGVLGVSVGLEVLNARESQGKELDELLEKPNKRMFLHKQRTDTSA